MSRDVSSAYENVAGDEQQRADGIQGGVQVRQSIDIIHLENCEKLSSLIIFFA
jgi:hypothetical protein